MDLIAYMLAELVQLYTIIVIINVILSWAVMMTQNYNVRKAYWFTNRFTDPVLAPIRRVLYPYTRNLGLDFSPLILIFLLYFLQNVLRGG